MSKNMYSDELIIRAGQFTQEDMKKALQGRRDHNRHGFAYQMATGIGLCVRTSVPDHRQVGVIWPEAKG